MLAESVAQHRFNMYGVGVNDVATLAAVSLLLAVASFANLLPAYRATRVNPLEAVRTE